jgi:hypothetical protein
VASCVAVTVAVGAVAASRAEALALEEVLDDQDIHHSHLVCYQVQPRSFLRPDLS